jgi:hypothetical protein
MTREAKDKPRIYRASGGWHAVSARDLIRDDDVTWRLNLAANAFVWRLNLHAGLFGIRS